MRKVIQSFGDLLKAAGLQGSKGLLRLIVTSGLFLFLNIAFWIIIWTLFFNHDSGKPSVFLPLGSVLLGIVCIGLSIWWGYRALLMRLFSVAFDQMRGLLLRVGEEFHRLLISRAGKAGFTDSSLQEIFGGVLAALPGWLKFLLGFIAGRLELLDFVKKAMANGWLKEDETSRKQFSEALIGEIRRLLFSSEQYTMIYWLLAINIIIQSVLAYWVS